MTKDESQTQNTRFLQFWFSCLASLILGLSTLPLTRRLMVGIFGLWRGSTIANQTCEIKIGVLPWADWVGKLLAALYEVGKMHRSVKSLVLSMIAAVFCVTSFSNVVVTLVTSLTGILISVGLSGSGSNLLIIFVVYKKVFIRFYSRNFRSIWLRSDMFRFDEHSSLQ